MKIRNMALISVLSATLLAPVAFASDTMSKDGENNAATDTMGNKGESKADRSTPAESSMGTSGENMQSATFDKLDANKDGMISEDELSIYGSTAAGGADSEAERNQMTLEDNDTDGDGAISREEFEKAETK
ncbi:EF-hand domain-containing protein [Marinobacter sp. 1Y8]